MSLTGPMPSLFGGSISRRAELSAEEQARQLRYLISAHYASSDEDSDGKTRCPLYYSSIEGIVGNSELTVAKLKGLPVEDPPSDYVMIDLFNCFPMALDADMGCILNDFSWERMQVVADGTQLDDLTDLGKRIIRESESRGTWSFWDFLFGGGSAGDHYIRPKPDPKAATGICWHGAGAEGVFPNLAPWNQKVAEGYRLIYSITPSEIPANVAMMGLRSKGTITETHVEEITADGVHVYVDDKPVDEDPQGIPASGDNPRQLDEPPLAHFAYRPSRSFFGKACCDADTLDLIDQANLQASNLSQIGFSYGLPQVVAEGLAEPQEGEDKKKGFKYGRRGVIGVPIGGKVYFLAFDGLDQFLQIVETYGAKLQKRVPQFILDDIRSGNTGESGIALEYRLFKLNVYLAILEGQIRKAITDALRISFKMLGKWPTQGEVEVLLPFGARFPIDVAARLAAAEKRIGLFGRTKRVVMNEARAEDYDQETLDEIEKTVDRATEAELAEKENNAFGGGLIGAAAAEEQRQAREKRRAEEGA